MPASSGMRHSSPQPTQWNPQPLSLAPTVPEVRDIARIYRRLLFLRGGEPRANAAYIRAADRALTGTDTEPTGIPPTYRTHGAWKTFSRDDSLPPPTGPATHDWLTSVAFGAGPDGRRCWPPAAATGRCGCGTRPPARPSAAAHRPHRPGARWRSAPARTGGCCWPAAAPTGRCGCGTRPPAQPAGQP